MPGDVPLRSGAEIACIGEAAQVVRGILDDIAGLVRPGLTTLEIDALAEARLAERGARPAFKGYQGFPACICISINDEVVHGIPSASRALSDGDVVSLDFGAVVAGWYGDAAVTLAVGSASDEAQRLLAATRGALAMGVAQARPGARIGDVGAAIQDYVESQGFSVVRELVGHGIGRRLHEPPQVPNFGRRGRGELLRAGMVLAIEPMVNAGRPEVRTLGDGWTVVTADGSLSAHFEHTVAITDAGPVVLSGTDPLGCAAAVAGRGA